MAGFFSRLKEGLARTRESVAGRVDELIHHYQALDDDFTRT